MGDLPVPMHRHDHRFGKPGRRTFTAAFPDRTAITQPPPPRPRRPTPHPDTRHQTTRHDVIDENVDALLQKLENFSADGILSRVDGKLYLKSDFFDRGSGIAKGQWAMKDLDSTAQPDRRQGR